MSVSFSLLSFYDGYGTFKCFSHTHSSMPFIGNETPKTVHLLVSCPAVGFEIQAFGTIYPGGYSRKNLFFKVFVLSLRSGQPIIALPRKMQSNSSFGGIISRGELYISCPGRILLREQQVLSKNIVPSKTVIYATSCRNNVWLYETFWRAGCGCIH